MNDHPSQRHRRSDRQGLDAFQAEVARVALVAAEQQGFALAGAGALVAHGVTDRPTQDLDLFTTTQGGPGRVSAVLQAALVDAGFEVVVREAAEQHAGEFLRLQVSKGEQIVDLDLGRDWRQHAPVRLDVGAVLHLEDAVGNKVTALLGRALPRDYLDVASALDRYDRRTLLRLGFQRDPGLSAEDVAEAMRLLDRLSDEPFADYELSGQQVAAVRARFADWPRDATEDHVAAAAHREARQADIAHALSTSYPVPLAEAVQAARPVGPTPPITGTGPRPGAAADQGEQSRPGPRRPAS